MQKLLNQGVKMNTVMSHVSKRHVAELRYSEACNKAVSLEELFRWRNVYV